MTTRPIKVATMAAACLMLVSSGIAVAQSSAPDRLQRGEEVLRTLKQEAHSRPSKAFAAIFRSWPMRSPATRWATSGAGRVSTIAHGRLRRSQRSLHWGTGHS
jgi:hypothetical protein